MDKECHVSGEIADMRPIHPKMSQEGLAHFVVDKMIAPDLSALGMARLLLQILFNRKSRNFSLLQPILHTRL
jgi:hypothetical protein